MSNINSKKLTLEQITKKYLSNGADDGRFGRSFEVEFRKKLTGAVERVHPLGVADVLVKSGVTIECKTGCGWLVNAEFETAEDAMKYFENSYKPMIKASHVAYLPKWTGSNTEDAIILTQRKFLKILEAHNLIRSKKSTQGLYGISIQSYIPTPTFKASQAVYDNIVESLKTKGETIEEFANRVLA